MKDEFVLSTYKLKSGPISIRIYFYNIVRIRGHSFICYFIDLSLKCFDPKYLFSKLTSTTSSIVDIDP